MTAPLTDLADELHRARLAYADWATLPPALKNEGFGARCWCRLERARAALLDAWEVTPPAERPGAALLDAWEVTPPAERPAERPAGLLG